MAMGELYYVVLWSLALAGLVAIFWFSYRSMNSRRLPASLQGVRIEVMPPVRVEDRVVDADWEIPLVATNRTRRPRAWPLLGASAQVKTERARYNAVVETELDWNGLELNPEGTALGSVRLTRPGGQVPRSVSLQQIQPHQYVLKARFQPASL